MIIELNPFKLLLPLMSFRTDSFLTFLVTIFKNIRSNFFSANLLTCVRFVLTFSNPRLKTSQTMANNGIRSAAKGRVDRCPARAAAAVQPADPTFRPEYSAHYRALGCQDLYFLNFVTCKKHFSSMQRKSHI